MNRISRSIFFLAIILFSTSVAAQDSAADKTPLIREAKQHKGTYVTCEGYVENDLFEVTVSSRLRGERPVIKRVLLVGPGIGKLYPVTRKPLYATAEEEDPYETEDVTGLISAQGDKKTKKVKGRLARMLFTFKVPVDKIREGKRYQLWVKIESEQSAGAQFRRFRFDLPGFDTVFSQ